MAITLNKCAVKCEQTAIANGVITDNSSARPLLYDISRHWRELLDASSFISSNPGPWSEREEAAARVLISTITYLQRIGCRNIEKLLKDIIEQQATQNE